MKSNSYQNIHKGFILKIYHLTRNVNIEHLKEIFSSYGKIISIDLPIDPLSRNHKGFASIE